MTQLVTNSAKRGIANVASDPNEPLKFMKLLGCTIGIEGGGRPHEGQRRVEVERNGCENGGGVKI